MTTPIIPILLPLPVDTTTSTQVSLATHVGDTLEQLKLITRVGLLIITPLLMLASCQIIKAVDHPIPVNHKLATLVNQSKSGTRQASSSNLRSIAARLQSVG